MASVDADFEQPRFEPRRAPCVAASRSKPGFGRRIEIAIVEVGVEDVAFQALSGSLHELGNVLEAPAEWLGENLLERVATYRVIGNLGRRDRLPGKKPAAVHGDKAFGERDLVRVLGCFCAYGTVSIVSGMTIVTIAQPSPARSS